MTKHLFWASCVVFFAVLAYLTVGLREFEKDGAMIKAGDINGSMFTSQREKIKQYERDWKK